MTDDQRRSASRSILERLASVLEEKLKPRVATEVGLYWPIQGEPDLTVLPFLLPQIDWSLPVVVRRNAPLEFHPWTGDPDDLEPGGFGTRVPKQRGRPLTTESVPDILVVPLVGFDRRGYRLGYGGGYYDRTLAATRPRPFAIGVGFELSRLDELPAAAHDQAMDLVITDGLI